jgi:NAD(P)-dependent dehydrogenase (short-subunit alcohol dehydrogenase family)
MKGKTVVLTGFTAGLGKAAAFDLAGMGANLYLIARNEEKGEKGTHAIQQRFPGAKLQLAIGDLANLADVRRIARDFKSNNERLDVLFNNAGVINQRRRMTVDGYEETFAVNHLSHFLLTNLLIDSLRESQSGRVVSTASGAHRFGGRLDFNDLQSSRKYSTFSVYGRSKLANILFTQELARREAGTGITANCFHPGFVGSDFSKNNGSWARWMMTLGAPFARSPEKGAETGVYLCSSSEVAQTTGGYFYDMKATEPSASAFLPGDAEKLWEISAELVGLGD